MELMRSTWTDSRLDDLNHRVDEIRVEVRELRKEMGSEMNGVRGEIGGLNRTIIQVGGGVIATLVVGLLGLVATQL
jgi:hypothetical protein